MLCPKFGHSVLVMVRPSANGYFFAKWPETLLSSGQFNMELYREVKYLAP